MNRLGLLGTMTVVMLGACAPSALAADGALDPSFAAGAGFRIDRLEATGPPASFAQGLTLAPDGSPVVTAFAHDATGAETQFTTAKYRPDGSALDPAFATAGVRRDQAGFGTTKFSGGGAHLTYAPDGTLVVPGSAGDDGMSIDSEADIQRYTAAGGLDTAFAGGSLRHDFSATGHTSSFSDAAVNPDNSVVAAGSAQDPSGHLETLIAKYTPAGSLDPSFGSGGAVRQQLGSGPDVSTWFRIVRQADGRLVALGQTSGTVNGIVTLVERFNADGTPDATFGTAGLVRLQLSTITPATEKKTVADGLAVDAAGQVYVGATVSYVSVGADDDRFEQAIVKLLPNGLADPSFGTGGIAMGQFGHDGPGTHADTTVDDLALAPDGRIVTAGTANDAGDRTQVLITRYEPNGTPDPVFGSGGAFIHQFADGTTSDTGSDAEGVAVTPTGAIVFAGDADATGPSPHLRTLVGRLTGNTAPAAVIAPLPMPVKEEAPVTFDATQSTDDGDIVADSWDLNGDGQFGDSTSATPVTAFGPGPHTVALKVTDSYGLTSVANTTFTALAEPGLLALPGSGTVSGTTLSLTVRCTAGGPACTGGLALSAIAGTHAKTARATKRKHRRARSYGTARFTKIKAGQAKTLKLHLTLAAQAALHHHTRIHGWLIATTKAASRTATVHRTIALRVHRVKHKHAHPKH